MSSSANIRDSRTLWTQLGQQHFSSSGLVSKDMNNGLPQSIEPFESAGLARFDISTPFNNCPNAPPNPFLVLGQTQNSPQRPSSPFSIPRPPPPSEPPHSTENMSPFTTARFPSPKRPLPPLPNPNPAIPLPQNRQGLAGLNTFPVLEVKDDGGLHSHH